MTLEQAKSLLMTLNGSWYFKYDFAASANYGFDVYSKRKVWRDANGLHKPCHGTWKATDIIKHAEKHVSLMAWCSKNGISLGVK